LLVEEMHMDGIRSTDAVDRSDRSEGAGTSPASIPAGASHHAVLRQAEAAIRQSEERFRAFMDNSPAVAFMKDADGRYVYLNDTCRRRVVQPGVEWIGRTGYDLFPHDVAERLRVHDMTVLRSGRPIEVLETVPDCDGRIRQWLSHKFPFRDSAGRQYVGGHAIDITERREAERAVVESGERLAAALTASRTGTFRWDLRTDVLVADDELHRLLGLDPAGRLRIHTVGDCLALIHPDDRPVAAEQFRRSVDEGTAFDLDFRVVWPDGSLHWLHGAGRVFRDEHDKISYMSGACVDVTDRKRAELALAQSERFARAALDALSAHIAILDADGVIIDVNRAWQEFAERNCALGVGRRAIGAAYGVGRNYLFVCDAAAAAGDDRETARAAADGIRRVLAGARDEFYLEYPCHSPTAQRWFALRVTRFAGGPPARFVVAHENITARHHATAMRREQVALKDAVAAMEQVLGVVGHELRTPLAGVRAMAEFVLTDGARGTAEFDMFLRGMHDEVVRMAETVNNLLEAARLNSGKARWNWGAVDLGAACRDALDSVRPLVDAAAVDLSLEVAPADLRMAGDGDAIRRLVLNLLSNAHKHTTCGSIRVSVGLRADAAGPLVGIDVVDTGSGIAPEVRDRLGQAFALNAGVVGGDHVSGTGLGLAICSAIVAAHGGTVRVDSRPGEGTRITVLLRPDLPGPRDIGRDVAPAAVVSEPIAPSTPAPAGEIQ
jgi:PAS domain S-box-containing protein